MIFPKPDLKYTEMAMYVDEKVKLGKNLTEQELEKIYIYLYHLTRMLAYKNHYFNRTEYYDDFSLTMASDMMNRLIYNPKLYEYDESGEPAMKHIKSCLNYLKAVIYGRKVNYEQQTYSQKILQLDEPTLTVYTFENQLRDAKRSGIESNVTVYLNDLGRTVKDFINKRCVYSDKITRKNIRISCCLSLLNSIIFTKEIQDRLKSTYRTQDAKFLYLCREYALNKENCVILYHLDESFRDYITVMVRRIFKFIEADIKELSIGDTTIPDNVLANIAFAELDGRTINDD